MGEGDSGSGDPRDRQPSQVVGVLAGTPVAQAWYVREQRNSRSTLPDCPSLPHGDCSQPEVKPRSPLEPSDKLTFADAATAAIFAMLDELCPSAVAGLLPVPTAGRASSGV
ncbi:hypothetical protein Ato02nite_099610 [Paractinoplanes toevensis]|uniref:Uncharacterized protein n=1 Tax=Paractinoplanes toevensis TaxID=571911 RepID=A0A919WDN1_9ACTN|nr:hypothetical protein Ato02nite_099610 [Actinoplanes toevensis]